MKISSSLSKLSLSTKVSKLKVKVEVIEGGFCCFPAIVNAASGHCLETKSGLRLSSHSPWLIKNTSTTIRSSSIALDEKLLEKTIGGIEWCFTIWFLNGICASMSDWARSLACLCLYLSLVNWLVWSVIVGWVFVGMGFDLAWGGFAGFQLTWDVFFSVEIFFFLGWLCCIFGLIWYFGVLGFDDFVGFEKMVPLRFMILFMSWNFLGFLCVCFLRKF